MANPTEAEIQTQISNIVKLLDETRKYAGVNATNYLALEDTALQSLETDYQEEISRGLASMRSGQNSSLLAGAAAVGPLFLDYAKNINVPEKAVLTALARVYRNFADGAKRIASRQFTFGTPAAGGANAGNGTINRLNKDEYNFDIEAQTPDAKYAECVADEHSGAAEHEEVFKFDGQARERDFLKITGSGKSAPLRAKSARDSFRFIDNPSFSQYSGTSISALTSLPGWTPNTAIGNFALVEGAANTYRDFVGDTTPRALKISANDKLSQNLNVKQARVDPNVPIYIQLAWNRSVGVGDGTLSLKLGSQTESVVLAAQAGWQILRIPVGQKNWFKTWNKEDPTVEVELAGRTTGYVLVDDIVMTEYERFDGSWYAIVGGSTPFLRRDSFSWTDTAIESKIQQWLWRLFGLYLPHTTGGGITWADPA